MIYDRSTPYALPPFERRHRAWYWTIGQCLKFWLAAGRALPKLFGFGDRR